MFKRVTIVALVVAAFFGAGGPRPGLQRLSAGTTRPQRLCSICHQAGQPASPPVYHRLGRDQARRGRRRRPGGTVSRTAPAARGCHTSNYAPSKVVPTPTGNRLDRRRPSHRRRQRPSPTVPRPSPSADRRRRSVLGELRRLLVVPLRRGHGVLAAVRQRPERHGAQWLRTPNLANAEICGQCHSRYSYTVDTYRRDAGPVPQGDRRRCRRRPIRRTRARRRCCSRSTRSATRCSAHRRLRLESAAPLSTVLNVPSPGWTPTPNPAATTAAGLQTYWQIDGVDTRVAVRRATTAAPTSILSGLTEGHANALTRPQGRLGPQPARAAASSATPPTTASLWSPARPRHRRRVQVRHHLRRLPHPARQAVRPRASGTRSSRRQLAHGQPERQNLCVECHNGEIPEGTTATPGTEIHHPMKEMIDGYGAIDVSAFPSVHKGKCVQCHMPPTSISRGASSWVATTRSRSSSRKDAIDASPIPSPPRPPSPPSTPVPAHAGRHDHLTVTQDGMPYSACSTCHNNNNSVKATPMPCPTVGHADSGLPARSGDRHGHAERQRYPVGNDRWRQALWLQDTIDQRQEWTKAKIAEISDRARRRQPCISATPTPTPPTTALVAIPADQVDHGRACLPQRLHEHRVRGERGQLRPPQLGLLEGDRQHGHAAGEDRRRPASSSSCRGR